ncbi:tRNA (guanosine(18)-2'-O)-methyltransferase TrmH [Gemmatimonadota bacterium]
MAGIPVVMNPERFRRLQEVLKRRQPDLTVLMEKVNKTHNFSAILRNCDAVGILEAHAVLPKKEIDLHHHTSAGTSKWVQVLVHETVEAAASHLRSQGFKIVAAHPSPEAVDYREIDFTQPVALMVGAELDGISDVGLSVADALVAIPMLGMVRSLNVSVATALLLFEALRQRQAVGLYSASRLPEEPYRRLLFEWAHPDLARHLRKKGQPYPPLSEEGDPL